VTGYHAQVEEAASVIRAAVTRVPSAAVVLGSGLGAFAGMLEGAVSIPYDALPHWPRSRVEGHDGRLAIGRTGGTDVIALAGRCHAYEGHDWPAVTFAVRVLGTLGVKTLVLTNAAGGINAGFAKGALMVVDDHLNLTGGNPLAGPNDDRFGPRFPDMTDVYAPRLRQVADAAGEAIGLRLRHGVYAGVLGPSYETPAEIRYLRTIGADAVGMSTVAEAIVARHMGLEVLGVSCITNMAAGISPGPLDHGEVMATARRVRAQFTNLLEVIVERL
jgi:purine-nucleoside phosphorylase